MAALLPVQGERRAEDEVIIHEYRASVITLHCPKSIRDSKQGRGQTAEKRGSALKVSWGPGGIVPRQNGEATLHDPT